MTMITMQTLKLSGFLIHLKCFTLATDFSIYRLSSTVKKLLMLGESERLV